MGTFWRAFLSESESDINPTLPPAPSQPFTPTKSKPMGARRGGVKPKGKHQRLVAECAVCLGALASLFLALLGDCLA